MNILGIIFLVLIVFSLLSGGGGFYYSKSKSKINSKNHNQGNPNDAFENNKKIWQHNIAKTVTVPFFNYQENYNEFPFFSDYAETKEFLIKKGVSSKKIDELLKVMEAHESNFLRIWSEQQRRLLRTFDQTRLGASPSALIFLLGFYNQFLDSFRQEVIDFLINKILVAELGSTLGLDPQKTIQATDYRSYIHNAVEAFYMQINADVNQIIDRLYNEIRAQFNNFYNQFQQNNYHQQQQTAFQEEFDEIGLAYKTLGVDADINDEDLKKSYRKLAMQYHPDKNPSQEAKEKMAKINSAYDLVKKMRNIK